MSVASEAVLLGTPKMHALIDDNPSIYVRDDSPNAQNRYRARFYFNPTGLP